MSPSDAANFIRLLREVTQELLPQPADTTGAQRIAGFLSSVNNSIQDVASQLRLLNDSINHVATETLEATSIMVLNRENAKLTAELTNLRVAYRQLQSVVTDLSLSCIGCKKTAWAPHAPGCEWASVAAEAMRKALEKDGTEHRREAPSSD